MPYFFDKRLFNFLVIIFLSVVTVFWTFFIFKESVSYYFLVTVVFFRCIFSFALLRDYMASWSKSTQKTFLRKVFINLPVFVIVLLLFYGRIRLSILFSEFLFYLLLLNFSVYLYWYIFNRSNIDKTKTVVVYGAGVAGTKIAQEFYETNYSVKYFVDDNVALQKRSIDGKRILSRLQMQQRILSEKIDLLVIALPSIDNSIIKQIYKNFDEYFTQIKIIPSLENILQDKSFMSQLKSVSLYDLLSRDTKSLDIKSIRSFMCGKTVLVTGAGGSIGSEIVRQCIKYGAKKLVLLDNSEFNLYKLTQEIDSMKAEFVMGSVLNKILLEGLFCEYNIDIVFHTAAYKHVPLVESNISEAIENNVIGTKNTIDMAIKYSVESFILISTDKAVRPTNVMGATKRICELYLQNVVAKNTRLAAVRFGNVLGSSGSVIPKFEEQIRNNEPITVTHPDITRYFMLISEACELVLQAGAIAKSSEVFVLDMGKPIRIMDLAKKFKKLAGRDDIEIKIIGLRPGEKLYEELLIDENDTRTDHKDIFIGKETFYDIKMLSKDIDTLVKSSEQIEALKKIVPEFEHRVNL